MVVSILLNSCQTDRVRGVWMYMNFLLNKYTVTKYLTFLLFVIITYLLLSLCLGNWLPLPGHKTNIAEFYYFSFSSPNHVNSMEFPGHPSLSSIASDWSSLCMQVSAGWPALVCPCVGVYKRRSLMSSSLLIQQSPEQLVSFILMVSVLWGKWSYSCCFVRRGFQNSFKTACSINHFFL